MRTFRGRKLRPSDRADQGRPSSSRTEICHGAPWEQVLAHTGSGKPAIRRGGGSTSRPAHASFGQTLAILSKRNNRYGETETLRDSPCSKSMPGAASI